MPILKNRKLEIRVKKDDGSDEIINDTPAVAVDPEQIATLVQDTSRIIVTHAIFGVGTYVLLDTFRKVVVKMVPGH